MRSYASGFIFTTALPPAVAAGALASVRHLKHSQFERQTQQDRVRLLKRRLGEAGIPMLPSDSHIVPVLVGDPLRCKDISDQLMERFDIYVQPINYPTVPRGTERLRLTPGPLHSREEVERLVAALSEVWGKVANRKVA